MRVLLRDADGRTVEIDDGCAVMSARAREELVIDATVVLNRMRATDGVPGIGAPVLPSTRAARHRDENSRADLPPRTGLFLREHVDPDPDATRAIPRVTD